MSYSLIWLPDVLRRAGLKVAVEPGFETRGRGDMGWIAGIICHHTAGRREGNMPSLRVVRDGRSDLPGPLAQLGLGRDGTFYCIAAGRANHAGRGSWRGRSNGNTSFIGIEAENTGLPNDFPWPSVQMEAYQRGCAAILTHVGRSVDWCIGHKEFAVGRKPDPTFDMRPFRSAVAAIMAGAAPPVLIPAYEPPQQGGAPGRRTLRRGDDGPLVRELQSVIGADVDGDFGAKTEAALRAFQRRYDLVPDGIAGPKTWKAVDRVRMVTLENGER